MFLSPPFGPFVAAENQHHPHHHLGCLEYLFAYLCTPWPSTCKFNPCFTPLVTGKGLENLLSSFPRACMPSWNSLTILTNFSWQPSLAMIFYSPSRFTVSKTLVRSTKLTYRRSSASSSALAHSKWTWSLLSRILHGEDLSSPEYAVKVQEYSLDPWWNSHLYHPK